MGRLDTRFFNVVLGICPIRHINGFTHWFWMRRSGLQSAFQVNEKVFSGLRHDLLVSFWTSLCAFTWNLLNSSNNENTSPIGIKCII